MKAGKKVMKKELIKGLFYNGLKSGFEIRDNRNQNQVEKAEEDKKKMSKQALLKFTQVDKFLNPL